MPGARCTRSLVWIEIMGYRRHRHRSSRGDHGKSETRMSRSPSSGAHSRDPLAHAGYACWSSVSPFPRGDYAREVSFALWARLPCDEGLDDPIEETRRQEAVVIAITAAEFPKVIARPIEFVALCNNDPGTFVIKSEMPFDRGGNFNCASGIGGRIMRDWQNDNDGCVIHGALNRKHDHARAIFAPFFPTRFVFVVPQIGIGYDKARFRRRDRHAPSLFRLNHGIEMRVSLVHA